MNLQQAIKDLAGAIHAEKTARNTLAVKLQNLSVGGCNILLNTSDFSKNWRSYKHSTQTAIQSLANGIYECEHLTTNWSELAQDNVITFDKIPLGARLMLSFEAKTNVAGGLRFVFRELYTTRKSWTYSVVKWVNLEASDGWVRYEVELPTMSTNSNAENPVKNINFLLTNWIIRRFAIRKLKLEIGTVATAWSPAYEDLQAENSALKDEIAVIKQRLERLETS